MRKTGMELAAFTLCVAVTTLLPAASGAAHQTTGGATGQAARELPPPPPLPPPNIAGRWELNVEASDPMPSGGREPGEENGGGRDGASGGGRGGGMGGRGGGMGGRGGMEGRRGGMEGNRGGRESASAQDEMRRIMEAQRVLLIVQHEASLSLTDDEGRVVTIKPDGAKVKEEQAGESVERTSKWDGRSLVTQVKLSNGARVTQTYSKVNEGLQLVVATKIEGGRFPKPMEFKRVYDQALQ